MSRFLKVRVKSWEKKAWYENLKDFGYQADKVNNVDKEKKDEDEADETDQELPPWIESKDEFNELENHILSVKSSKLKTETEKYMYDYNYMKKLVKDIDNNKITKNDPINKVKEYSGLIDEIKRL